MASILEPLADAELVLGSTEETGLLLGVLTTLYNESIKQHKTGDQSINGGNCFHLRRTEREEPCPEGWQMRLAYVHGKKHQRPEPAQRSCWPVQAWSPRRGAEWQAVEADGKGNG